MMIVGIYSMMNSTIFQISSVGVHGVDRVSPDDVTSALDLEHLSILTVDVGAIQETLKSAFPELTDVKVDVELPNVVTISAKERTPVLELTRGDKIQWVDADGVIFSPRGEPSAKLIKIDGADKLPAAPVAPKPEAVQTAIAAEANDATDPAQAAADQQAKTQAAKAAYSVDPTFIKAVQELNQKLPEGTLLVYNRYQGLGWEDPQGFKVYIGKDLSDFDQKYLMYQKLSAYLAEQGIKPSLLSVERLGAPYYRLEQ
jgi:hypothetical protein